jgi:hypothetical protein
MQFNVFSRHAMIFCNEPPILCEFEMSLKLEQHICNMIQHMDEAHYTHTSEPHLMAFVSANVHQKWASAGLEIWTILRFPQHPNIKKGWIPRPRQPDSVRPHGGTWSNGQFLGVEIWFLEFTNTLGAKMCPEFCSWCRLWGLSVKWLRVMDCCWQCCIIV